jgi:hypothetical protein
MKDDEGKRLVPWLLSGLLLAPSVLWIAWDRSAWSWDPSFYAMDTTDLWYVMTHHPTRWPGRMIAIFQGKAPGIAWLGQFFVPVGRWLGSVEAGLLASVLLCQLLALVLVYLACRRVAPGSALSATAGTLLVASSPLFVAMSHHYLTEALQLACVAYVVWIAIESPRLPWPRILLHLCLAGIFGLLAKISTPAYVAIPAGIALARAVVAMRSAQGRPVVGGPELRLAIPVVALGGFGLAWYAKNGKAVLAFSMKSASSEMALDYGSRRPFLDKVVIWLTATGKTLFVPASAWVLLLFALVATALVLLRKRRGPETTAEPAPGGGLVLLLLAQVLLVLAIMSTTINEEIRYLLPLAPMFAVTLTWLLARLASRPATALVLLLLSGQWVSVHARTLGVLPPEEGAYWSGAPAADAARMKDLKRLVEVTCDERSVGRWSTIGVNFEWLNHYTLMFYATKDQFDHPGRCYYQYLGHAPKDPDEAMRLVHAMDGAYFISLEIPAMPMPPDYLNVISAEVTRRVEGDPAFQRVPFTSSSGISLHRRR